MKPPGVCDVFVRGRAARVWRVTATPGTQLLPCAGRRAGSVPTCAGAGPVPTTSWPCVPASAANGARTSGASRKPPQRRPDGSRTKTSHTQPPDSSAREIRRALRLVGWNALFLVAGLALVGVVGETYFRLRAPFVENHTPSAWSPTVGRTFAPNAEVRYTNVLDFWTVTRTNSLGFPDREPIGLERAAASCHIAMIGDSYVEALQVPIADKFHVRLEALAARELRHLDVTTSAFGISGTGQVNQLAYSTNSHGSCGPLCWCSSSFPTTSRTMRPSWKDCTREWIRTDSSLFPRHEAPMGASRCGRPIPTGCPESPPRLLHLGIRASWIT